MANPILTQVIQALLTAILLPAGLLLSLTAVRILSALSRVALRGRPLPIVVHPLNFEHGMRRFVPSQEPRLLELPSRIRDFIAGDITLRERLAPGPVSPIAPSLSSATPTDTAATSWASHLLEVIYPRLPRAYNVILVPEVPAAGLAVGAQIVETPTNRLVAARSFGATDIDDLTVQVGGFCVESVLEQPKMLRQSPRWEHWSRGAYTEFRRANELQTRGRHREAHIHFQKAAQLAPGNARIALHHASLYEAMGDFKNAAVSYNELSCLWRQNVDVSFRLSAATINHVLIKKVSPAVSRGLIIESNRTLRGARRQVAPLFVWRKLARSFRPRWRDPGERRYWYSWLRPDPYRAPLKLLRRSKGHEYRKALEVSIAANSLLLHTRGEILAGDAVPSPTDLLRATRAIADRKRNGWLAHWGAACFFSRAIELADRQRPRRWRWKRDAGRVHNGSLSRFSALFGDDPTRGTPGLEDDWVRYCRERAVAELGKVLRNPCNQLDRRLLLSDPDMQRLRATLPDLSVNVLAGIGPLHDVSALGAEWLG